MTILMLAQVCKPGELTSAEFTRQHLIFGGMKGGKMKDHKSQYMHPKWQKRRLEFVVEMLKVQGY